jgi:uncharacterized damage-inducible protein DinB
MTALQNPALITPQDLLEHWQGHRGLTRKTIEAFPEDQLFSFQPAKPMRSFGTMMIELLGMVEPPLEGFKSGEFSTVLTDYSGIDSKTALLEAWDKMTVSLERDWKEVRPERLLAQESAYGFPARPLFHLALYLMDNEIHHRAQGYVYLRLLGIEPPPFYQR